MFEEGSNHPLKPHALSGQGNIVDVTESKVKCCLQGNALSTNFGSSSYVFLLMEVGFSMMTLLRTLFEIYSLITLSRAFWKYSIWYIGNSYFRLIRTYYLWDGREYVSTQGYLSITVQKTRKAGSNNLSMNYTLHKYSCCRMLFAIILGIQADNVGR